MPRNDTFDRIIAGSFGGNIIRLAVCAILFTHGCNRLLQGEVAGLADVLREQHVLFPTITAYLITLVETIGTLLVSARVLVWPVCTFLIIVLFTGIMMFNRHNGFFVVGAGEGGWEYNALLITCLVATMWENRNSKFV